MKKISIFILIIFSGIIAFAQPGCPSINAGPDVALNCNQTCANLNATVVATGTTATYSVIAVPYAPPYAYNTGTLISVGTDDIWSGLITLPFNFCFYDNNYSQIVVGSNGIISFNTAYAGQSCPWAFTASCPSASLPLNSIYGPYHDYYPTSVGNIRWALLGTYPCRTFVVNYDHIPEFSCTTLLSTSQIVIYESTNIIEVYMLDKQPCATWNSGNAIVGIQNSTGTIGLAAPGRNTGSWSAHNEAWRFTPNGPPNYTVTWYQGINSLGTGNAITVCPTATTTYTAEAVYINCNGNAVTVSDNVTVTPNMNFNLSVTPTNPTFCQGDNITLTASGTSTSYTWTPSTGLNIDTGATVIANPNVSTAYVVTGTNGVCTGTDTVFVTVNPIPVLMATGSVICFGDTGTVTANSTEANTTYLWSPTGDTINPIVVNPTVTTTYKVIGTAAGCKDSTTANVTVNPLPLINVDNVTICNGFAAQIVATNGITYVWEDTTTLNPRFVEPTQTTTYWVIGTDANGCKNIDSSIVIVNNSPTVNVDPVAICKGVSTTLTATGADTYIWSNSLTGSPIVVSPSSTTIYTVTGSILGCTGTDTAMVTVYPKPVAAFQPNPALTTTDNPIVNFFNSSSGGSQWFWNFGDFNSSNNTSFDINPTHSFSSYGSFSIWLVAVSDYGCTDSTVRNVIVENPFTFYIPTAFSPNGEGNNEMFIPQGVGIDLALYEMTIFDRWGELIFKTYNLFEGWNGKKNNVGSTLPSGTYIYHFKVRQIEGIKHNYSGHVTLIR